MWTLRCTNCGWTGQRKKFRDRYCSKCKRINALVAVTEEKEKGAEAPSP